MRIRTTGTEVLALLLAMSAALARAAPARVDCAGDPLPAGAVARLGTTRLQHGDEVHALALSPDGQWVATGGWYQGNVRLWNTSTGKEVVLEGMYLGSFSTLAFSPDGKLLAGGTYIGAVILWDATTAKEVRRMLPGGKVRAPDIRGVAFSRDGKVLAAADGSGLVRRWDVADGDELPALKVHKGEVAKIAFSPADPNLLAAADNETVRFWDLKTAKEVRPFAVPGPVGRCLAFSADGKTVATCGADQVIHLWDAVTGKEQRRLAAKDAKPVCLAFFASGRQLLAAGTKLVLWDAADGKKVRSWGEGKGAVGYLALSRDGKRAVTRHEDNRIRLWDTAAGKEVRGCDGHGLAVNAIAFSPDGRSLASAGDDMTVRLWDVATQRQRQCFKNFGKAAAVAYSPDGKLLASGSWFAGVIHIWDTAAGKESRRLERPDIFQTMRIVRRGCTSLAFSPDGKILATGHNADSVICLWDLTKTKEPRILQGHEDRVRDIAFSPDGRSLASGSSDKTIRLWEMATGKERACLKGHEQEIDSLAFSADGRRIASVSHDFTVRLWDVFTAENICLGDKVQGAPGCLAFSPDGRTLAVSRYGPDIQLWDMATEKVRGLLSGHKGQVHALAFSADGQKLASAGEDGTVLLWSVRPPKRTAIRRPAADPKAEPPSAKDLERRFAELAGADAARAHRALAALVAASDAAVSFLDHRLRPVPALDPKRMAQLLVDLDDDRFATREQAARQLADLSEMAGSPLRRALAAGPPLEVRRRIEGLLQRLDKGLLSPETLRVLRCLEALEAIGTPPARDLLRRMAGGEPAARLTQEARSSLGRLERRARQWSAAEEGEYGPGE